MMMVEEIIERCHPFVVGVSVDGDDVDVDVGDFEWRMLLLLGWRLRMM